MRRLLPQFLELGNERVETEAIAVVLADMAEDLLAGGVEDQQGGVMNDLPMEPISARNREGLREFRVGIKDGAASPIVI